MLALSEDARVFMHMDPIDLRKALKDLSYDRVSFPRRASNGLLFCIFT